MVMLGMGLAHAKMHECDIAGLGTLRVLKWARTVFIRSRILVIQYFS